MNKKYKIEACVESLQEAQIAEQRGADQIELCSRLDLDGLTPSPELINQCIAELNLDIKVMIRPRGGDFEYTRAELETMKGEIDLCKKLGVYGVVFGIRKGDKLDLAPIKELAIHAAPLNVTIHKAIDSTTDILSGTASLLGLHEHIHTILTSGGASTADEGLPQLKEMIKILNGKIDIMPAGKVTDINLESLHKQVQAPAYHGRKIVGELIVG